MEESQVFREIVLSLYSSKVIPSEHKSNFANELVTAFAPKPMFVFDESQLEQLLPSSDGRQRLAGEFDRACVYLTPPERSREMSPVLNISYDFYCDVPKISLRIGFFTREKTPSRTYIKGLGLRYESPEGLSSDGTGRHHFYHVQFIKGFKKDLGFPPRCCTDWLFDQEPSLPLDADNSIDLVLCLILSLYGRDEFLRFFNAIANVEAKKLIAKRIAEFRLNSVTSINRFWYWRASQAGAADSYYKTPEPPESFKQLFRVHQPGSRLTPLSRPEWNEIADDQFGLFPA